MQLNSSVNKFVSSHDEILFNKVRKGTSEYSKIRKKILTHPKKTTRNVVNSMDEILPGLFLGSQKATMRVKGKTQISHILSCRAHAPEPKIPYIAWKVLNLKDRPEEKIKAFFEQSYNFINGTKKGILIHCVMGVSRSASIVIAYLMKKYEVPFDAALKFVRSRRPIVKPNDGFIKQLKHYERTLHH
jgi:hypothetical protein